MSLPENVRKHLGAFDTPALAVAFCEDSAAAAEKENLPHCAYRNWLASAAIKECEASRKANEALRITPYDKRAVEDASEELGVRMAIYDALRRWQDYHPGTIDGRLS